MSSAVFSADRTYRYALTRAVAPLTGDGTVTFVGLNPSTADETEDDPTIRRCIDFARRWGYAGLVMLNLYAYRATDPRVMFAAEEPVGNPENDIAIAEVAAASDLVVCAWGAGGAAEVGDRARCVLDLIVAPHCLGLTKYGAPRHPLYVRADAPLQPFRP